MFGFAAASPRGEPDFQAAVRPVEATPLVPVPADAAGIPVTGRPEPGFTEIMVFYGLIGITTLFLILALLNVANKWTAPYIQRKRPPSDDPHDH